MHRKLVSFGCALALVANSVVALAQQPVPDKGKKQRHDIVTSNEFSFSFDSDHPFEAFSFSDHFPAMPALPMIEFGDGQAGFQYSYSTSIDGKIVKGKPYSADTVTEHIQTLGDGNRIVRRSTASVARDSEGRTRQEAVVMAFGPLAEAMRDLPKHVTIHDPVAGTTYMLNPKDKTASKVGSVMIRRVEGIGSTAPKAESNLEPGTQRVSGGVLQGNAVKKVQPSYPASAKAVGAEGAIQVRVNVNENGEVSGVDAVSGHPLLREAAVEAARQWKFKQTELNGKPVKVQGTLTFNFTLDGAVPNKEIMEKARAEVKAVQVPGNFEFIEKGTGEHEIAVATMSAGQLLNLGAAGSHDVQFFSNKKYESKKESLGKQNVEGVDCEGTRNTITIPAGEMGNELPINITTETWYSPDLQVTVLRKFNDPRYGEDVYRLTNINRAEPAKELFEVPSDYTVKENRGMFFTESERKIGEVMKMQMREIEEKMRKLQER